MTHIDNLAHIQSRVRDGEKWEYLSTTGGWMRLEWDEHQSVEKLNEYVSEGYQVRLAPKPPKPEPWSKPEHVKGPWVRPKKQPECAFLIVAVWEHGFAYHDSSGTLSVGWSAIERFEHSANPFGPFRPCTCAVEER